LLGNDILSGLPATELAELSRRLNRVDLRSSQVLLGVGQQIDSVWFPETAVISLVLSMPEGRDIQCGMIGREGIVGLGGAMTGGRSYTRQTVQISGSALHLGRSDLLRCSRELPEFGNYLHKSEDKLVAHCMQVAACLAIHKAEARLARILLEFSDRIRNDELRVTHDTLAVAIGATRQTATSILDRLEREGGIQIQRNRILILNRTWIATRTCSCYGTAVSTDTGLRSPIKIR
jgi:CRP-like cAMP-binding protein